MYVQNMLGFVEADRWDGHPLKQYPEHQRAIDNAASCSALDKVIVVRSRREGTVAAYANLIIDGRLPGAAPRDIRIFRSPPGWDYEWRIYLSAEEWGACMAHMAQSLSYRNFKSTCHERAKWQADLAHAIWDAAYDNDTN